MMARLMGLKTISPATLSALVDSQKVTVFDVNARESWLAARVPGSIHLDPLNYDAADLPDDRGAMIVFYCSNPLCRKAPLAARKAKRLGYENVHVLSAGISGWRSAGMPTERGA